MFLDSSLLYEATDLMGSAFALRREANVWEGLNLLQLMHTSYNPTESMPYFLKMNFKRSAL